MRSGFGESNAQRTAFGRQTTPELPLRRGRRASGRPAKTEFSAGKSADLLEIPLCDWLIWRRCRSERIRAQPIWEIPVRSSGYSGSLDDLPPQRSSRKAVEQDGNCESKNCGERMLLAVRRGRRRQAMNDRRTRRASGWLAGILLLWCGLASADPIAGDPTFLLPNSTTNAPVTFGSLRPVANGYALTSYYFDSEGNQVRQETGAVFSDTPGSLSWGIANSYSEMGEPSAIRGEDDKHLPCVENRRPRPEPAPGPR